MNAMFERLSLPVLTDIRLDAGGRDVIVPDVYAGQPTMITMKLPVSTGVLNVSGTVDGSIWAQQLAIGEKRSHAGVARLWARQRIGELMQASISGADPDWVRTQIVDLGLRFGLTSRYTSLVAIEESPQLAHGGNRRARIPTPVPGMAFPRTAAGVHYHLAWLLVMICALIALRFGRLA
jgi:Ca-activated chloride channel family protein